MRVLGAAALYAVATVVLTWPLFRHPGTTVLDAVSLYGERAAVLVQRDVNLTMWTLAWDAHALVTRPLRLFHANTFYPAPWSLAFSEHKLGSVPLFGPVYLASGNPVLAHQATLLATFVLAGLAMAAYVLYWTGDRAAALAGGVFYAFAPFRLWQLGSLDYVSIQYLPLVLLGIDAVLGGRGGRAAPAGLALVVLLSALCSYYVGYTVFVLAGTYTIVRLATGERSAVRRVVPVAVACVAAAAVVGVLTTPYVLLRRSGALPDYRERGFESLAFLGMLKFGPAGLLSWYVTPRTDSVPQFLTYTAMALVVAALVTRRSLPRAALAAVAIAGIVLSLGPELVLPGWSSGVTLPYGWLVHIVPGFSAMRHPQRFGALTTLAVMATAAFGLASVRQALRERGRGLAAAVLPALVVAAFLVEVRPPPLHPLEMRTGSAVPAVYRWLAAHGDGDPVLELPATRLDLRRESLFAYYSTYHWLPLVNGYSPYPPQSYVDAMEAVMKLPDPSALDAVLARVRPRWVVLHREYLLGSARADFEAMLRTTLEPVGEFGGQVLFEVPARRRTT